jgi:ribosomal protein S27AE
MADEPEKKLLNSDTVIEALKKVGATRGCPRCGSDTFKILSGFFVHSLQTSTRGISIGGPGMATWVLVCANCGFLSQHAAEVLNGVTQIERITN